MRIDIITLFPQMFSGPFDESIIHRAQEKGLVEIKIHYLRNWSVDERGTVDDRPFGGGPGMILKPEPIFAAVEDIKKQSTIQPFNHSTILLTPQGKLFNQKLAWELAKLDQMILICGHYEGVDERVREHLVDEEISIGDYILTGGELPAMVVTDAIVRLIPGVLEKPEAVESESFSTFARPGLANLEYPQYTRPENFRGLKVPEILLSGNHQEIEKWRQEQALKSTKEKRPDLLKVSLGEGLEMAQAALPAPPDGWSARGVRVRSTSAQPDRQLNKIPGRGRRPVTRIPRGNLQILFATG